jgi:hypothetical protein
MKNNFRYKDFNEWFKLYLPQLWLLRDQEMTNELLREILQEAFNEAREEMQTPKIESFTPETIPPCSVTAPVNTGWPTPKGRITL